MELLQQGSDAALALQVEIIPREILGLTGDSEARYAYKEYTGENKLARQLKGNPPAQGKGGWKESSKDPPSIRRRGRKEGTVSIRSPRMEKEFPSHGSWSPRNESLIMIPLDEGPLCGVECGRRSAPGCLPSKGGSLVPLGLFCPLSPWWLLLPDGSSSYLELSSHGAALTFGAALLAEGRSCSAARREQGCCPPSRPWVVLSPFFLTRHYTERDFPSPLTPGPLGYRCGLWKKWGQGRPVYRRACNACSVGC